MAERFDVLVVGGGINGAGIARDAVGRGLSVCLCERDDLASHTSSASTKLIHGGLRYLEQYEFRLVGKALAEREVLLRLAPHIIWPLRFVLPHQPHLRPAWMIRIGMFLYDHLGGKRTLEGSKRLNLRTDVVGQPLRDELTTGFAYSDAWVQDARMVVLNAMDAEARGATVHVRTKCVSARRQADHWVAELENARGERFTVEATSLINAAGPWAVNFLDDVATGVKHEYALRLVKGSHIVVPRMFDHDHAYIFQQPDRRIVFAIPYERDFTLVGTTDMEYHADPSRPQINQDEVDYLCEAANRYFKQSITPADVVWTYSGVRPLLEDEEDNASEVTRDYQLELDAKGAPLLSVFGGKLTTYRKLAEEAVDKLVDQLGRKAPAWTAHGAPLPGGEMAPFDELLAGVRAARPWLPSDMAWRLVRNYGERVEAILGKAASLDDLGEHFGADLYQAEVDYLRANEWVVEAEDLLWRRSKLGLRLSPGQQQRLSAYLSTQVATPAAPAFVAG